MLAMEEQIASVTHQLAKGKLQDELHRIVKEIFCGLA